MTHCLYFCQLAGSSQSDLISALKVKKYFFQVIILIFCYTICPRISCPFYKVNFYRKWALRLVHTVCICRHTVGSFSLYAVAWISDLIFFKNVTVCYTQNASTFLIDYYFSNCDNVGNINIILYLYFLF